MDSGLFKIVDSPYDMLDIEETATAEEIKKKYRQISLCASFYHISGRNSLNLLIVIHPDKCPHARAPEAFDLLKKVRIYQRSSNYRQGS